MSAFTRIWRPRPGMFGANLTCESASLGTGGTSISNSTTTSVLLAKPSLFSPLANAQLLSLSLECLVVPVMASGAITVQAFKNGSTTTALTSTFSMSVASTSSAYQIALTATDVQLLFKNTDVIRLDVVTGGTVNTQPTQNVVATWAVVK